MEEETVPQPYYSSRQEAAKESSEREQGFLANVGTGFETTALANMNELVVDEKAGVQAELTPEILTPSDDDDIVDSAVKGAYAYGAGLVAEVGVLAGYRSGEADYDKEAERERLTKDIPLSMQHTIMDQDNLAVAERARARILADVDRGRTLAAQRGLSPMAGVMIGSLVDVDLPLTFMTGGGYKAAHLAGKTLSLAKKMGVSPRIALRMSSSTTGLNAGLQAGLISGAAEATWSESADWTTIGEVALTGMLMGGAGGTVFKDVFPAIKAAQKELYDGISTGSPKFQSRPNVATMQPDTNMQGLAAGQAADVVESTAGASAVKPQAGTVRTVADDPLEMQGNVLKDIQKRAEDWRNESGWQDRKDAASEEWWTKIATSRVANVTTQDFNSLYTSKSAVANWMAGNIFESANGLGRGKFTAATGTEMYQKAVYQPIANIVPNEMSAWARRTGNTWKNSGFSTSRSGKETFNREVMLELNDRAMGRSSGRDPEIQRAADAYEQAGNNALGVGRGREGQTAVDGFDNIPDRRGYTPYQWNGNAMADMIKAGTVKKADMVNAMSIAYETAGIAAHKDAKLVASAVIDRAIAKDIDVDTSMINLLSADGREMLRTVLERNGTPAKDIERIIAHVTGDVEQKAQEGFTKFRNEIDMAGMIKTQDGSELRIVDLMDKDMGGVWNRYARRVAGAGALARVGITNRAQRKQFIDAMNAEKRALGEEEIPFDKMDAMFSNFNGGAVKGYVTGVVNEGAGWEVVQAKRFTNLALLNQLGVAQLAETGANIAAQGIGNWAQRSLRPLINKELREGNKELLDDLAFMMGEIGNDHKLFNPHLDMDDISKGDKNVLQQHLSRFGDNAQYIQGFTSTFNQVRGWQQRTAAMGVTDKIFRNLKESAESGKALDDTFVRRMESDFGLFGDDITQLENLITSGVIEFGEENGRVFVNKLNSDKWDADLALTFGASMTRSINQIVQKSMAGEQDVWMNNGVMSLLTHLKTFPLQAIQKQTIRNFRHMDKQSIATLGYGMATAFLALEVKDIINGDERSIEDKAKRAFGYSNMTGFVPMAFDPLMSVAGFDDYRINQYGPHSDIFGMAAQDTLQKTLHAPGAVRKLALGEDIDWRDETYLRALPFGNIYGLKRVFED